MKSLIKSGFGNVEDLAIEDIEPSCCPFCMWSQLDYFWIYSIQYNRLEKKTYLVIVFNNL
jgi:hypothetical protein